MQIENEDWNGNNQEQNNNAGNLSTGNGPEASAENKSVRLCIPTPTRIQLLRQMTKEPHGKSPGLTTL